MSLTILFLLNLFRTDTPIVIARDTTYITAPLRPDGLPDYEKYFLELNRKGATPENNAAVLLWKALWPNNLEPKQFESMKFELGLKETPSAEAALQLLDSDANRKRVKDWLAKQKIDTEEVDVADLIAPAIDHSWTSKQFQPLTEWVKSNQKPIDLLVEASHRLRFYSPSPTLLDKQDDILIAVLLPGAQNVREAARALGVRAMQSVGENRLNDAWRDLLALHRWARLAGQGHTIVEQLVAMAVSDIACRGTQALLSSDHLTVELARQINNDLATLPRVTHVVDCMNNAERLLALDGVIHMKTDGFEALSGGPTRHKPDPRLIAAVDWNVTLGRVNYWYDQLVAAASLPTRDAQKQALKKYEARLTADGQRIKQPLYIIASVFSRPLRSDVIGSTIASLMLPATDAAITAENRTTTSFQLTRLAAALTLFRAEHRTYPAKLSELVPGMFKELPVDNYNAKPFIYKRTDDGYLLYSVGDNGTDEGGDNEQMELLAGRPRADLNDSDQQPKQSEIRKDSDDIAIRLPRARFRLAKAGQRSTGP
jgi:hypothetical protein